MSACAAKGCAYRNKEDLGFSYVKLHKPVGAPFVYSIEVTLVCLGDHQLLQFFCREHTCLQEDRETVGDVVR